MSLHLFTSSVPFGAPSHPQVLPLSPPTPHHVVLRCSAWSLARNTWFWVCSQVTWSCWRVAAIDSSYIFTQPHSHLKSHRTSVETVAMNHRRIPQGGRSFQFGSRFFEGKRWSRRLISKSPILQGVFLSLGRRQVRDPRRFWRSESESSREQQK